MGCFQRRAQTPTSQLQALEGHGVLQQSADGARLVRHHPPACHFAVIQVLPHLQCAQKTQQSVLASMWKGRRLQTPKSQLDAQLLICVELCAASSCRILRCKLNPAAMLHQSFSVSGHSRTVSPAGRPLALAGL